MFKLCLQRTLGYTVSARAVLESVTAGKVLKVSHVQSCWMGTLGLNEQREHLNSPKRAKEFIYSLHPKERTCLLKELQSFESIAIAQETQETSPLTQAQIRYVLLHNAIPFIGFGFLDNAIMIAAGTQIELSIGVTFGLSTMAGKIDCDLKHSNVAAAPSMDIGRFGILQHSEWCSGLRHYISVQEASLLSLVRIQAVSHPDVIGSPIGRRTIGPASSGFGRCRRHCK
uniref:Uncharacterized protein n=1 Tax=Oncorhynchus tshawytscha TaxID=74940 RepID=A0AAZ3QB03_ONCTS